MTITTHIFHGEEKQDGRREKVKMQGFSRLCPAGKVASPPRNPQQQSSTGQAKDGRQEETQCVL
jgi:hypothetical protein